MINFNDPETWLDADIHNTPSGVDVEAYQAKIDSICGLTPSGKSCVKLSWMPSMENYQRYYSEWNDAGFGTKTVLRGEYVYTTVYDGSNPIDIPPPRWTLKQWLSGAQYGDDRSRWKVRYEGKQQFVRETRPPHPPEGRYIHLPNGRIGQHNHFCCLAAKKQGETCWGDYREPDESYLTLLRSAVEERNKENQNPNEPLTAETMERAALEAVAEMREAKARSAALMDAVFTENLDSALAYYTGSREFTEKKKEFSLPPQFKVNESGLAIPK